jgi:hypothetical protein
MSGWWKVKKSRKDAGMRKSGAETGMVWFDQNFLKTLKKQFEAVKPATWHKMMNPMCGACLPERGRNPKNFQIKWVSGQNTPLGADVESAN